MRIITQFPYYLALALLLFVMVNFAVSKKQIKEQESRNEEVIFFVRKGIQSASKSIGYACEYDSLYSLYQDSCFFYLDKAQEALK